MFEFDPFTIKNDCPDLCGKDLMEQASANTVLWGWGKTLHRKRNLERLHAQASQLKGLSREFFGDALVLEEHEYNRNK